MIEFSYTVSKKVSMEAEFQTSETVVLRGQLDVTVDSLDHR